VAEEYVKGLLSGGEVVLIDTRQHWMAALRFALRPILVALLGAVLIALSLWLGLDGILETLLEIGTAVVVIIAIIWLPIDLARWYSRKYVLTNRRAMRMSGIMRKVSFDSSLEQINDIHMEQSWLGRQLGYADLTLYTASDTANESYEQLLDGLQFKKAVLDAKEALRYGSPLEALPEGFIVKGGTNEASMRAEGKFEEATEASGESADKETVPAAPEPDLTPTPIPEPAAPEPVPSAEPEAAAVEAWPEEPASPDEPKSSA
jgi:hypothetical protein